MVVTHMFINIILFFSVNLESESVLHCHILKDLKNSTEVLDDLNTSMKDLDDLKTSMKN